MGDFRSINPRCNYNRISINGGLNPYSFLITLLHEIAHLIVFEKYGMGIKSHGCEWQLEYTGLIFPFLEHHLLPDELHNVLFKHFPFPAAASFSDKALVQVLRKFDKKQKKLLLQDLVDNEQFIFNGHIYQRIKKLRSYYYCIRISDHKTFRIHSLAEVEQLIPKESPEL